MSVEVVETVIEPEVIEDNEEYQEILDKILKCHLPGWDTVKSLKDVAVSRVSGAMTNIIYKCHNLINDDAYSPVLVRIYGKGSENFFDRKREIELFTVLSDNAFGIKLITKMKEGRVEQWMEGFQALKNCDVHEESHMYKIASKLACMHRIEIPNPSKDDVFDRILTWMGRVKRICIDPKYECFDFDNIIQEIKNYHELFDKDDYELVFAHLDLQHGNILQNENEDIMFVDFEYSGASSSAEDIANYFSEMMYDYNMDNSEYMKKELYPTLEQQKFFVRSYLEAKRENKNVSEEDVDKFLDTVHKHTCLCVLHWFVWGILESALSEIDWDYFNYAKDKIRYYYEIKQQYYGVPSLKMLNE
ncbi:hypothetical protein WA158_001057 [Blastocystis sp. Blastoise]